MRVRLALGAGKSTLPQSRDGLTMLQRLHMWGTTTTMNLELAGTPGTALILQDNSVGFRSAGSVEGATENT